MARSFSHSGGAASDAGDAGSAGLPLVGVAAAAAAAAALLEPGGAMAGTSSPEAVKKLLENMQGDLRALSLECRKKFPPVKEVRSAEGEGGGGADGAPGMCRALGEIEGCVWAGNSLGNLFWFLLRLPGGSRF